MVKVFHLTKNNLIGLIVTILVTFSSLIGVLIYLKNCQDCSFNSPNPPDSGSVWDEISFTLINNSLASIPDFNGKNLLLEFSSSQCSDCTHQIPVIQQFLNSSYFNVSLVVLTLFIDFSTQSELLDYYVDNNLTWLVGSISYSNYYKLGLSYIPSFHLFNSSGSEIDRIQNFVSYDSLLSFLGFNPLPSKNLASDVYHSHKNQININQKSGQVLISQNSFSVDSYLIGDTRNFYCLDTPTTYRTLSAQAVNISSHAYFFVEQGIITALGLGIVQNKISSEVSLFTENIYPVETSFFGDTNGSLGNIGDGKIIILYASLPSGWAGYFDPYNEYSQSSIGSYLSNEWEMIYLDYSDSFETTLAHEFQHLIHFNHDSDESIWFDEGCSELAAFLSGCFPSDWNNLTFFANLFKYSYDDSLVFWNYFSSNGRDVRIDYGGAYLFLLYFYEQFNSSSLSLMVNDTSSAVSSIHFFLSSFNMTFNDFFINWQIALFLDESEQYGYSNFDSTLSPLMSIDDKSYTQFSVPYYGSYGILFDFTTTRFEISLANPTYKKLGLVAFYYSQETLTDFEVTISSNLTFNILPSVNITHILLILSSLDQNFPLVSSGIGLGPFAYLSISTYNPYYLVTNTPLIEQNSTHLTVYALNIFFINNTEIFFSSGEDFVILEIVSDTFSFQEEMLFSLELFYGWGICSDITSLLPGTYDIFLHANTSDFWHSSFLSSFVINLHVEFSQPLLIVDSSLSSLSISINISILPCNLQEVLNQISVTAFIYNSSKQLYFSAQLYSIDYFTWSFQFDYSDFQSNNYYSVIYLNYQNQEFHSFPSQMVTISPSEPFETSLYFLPPLIIIFIFGRIIYTYYFSRRYIHEKQ